MDDGEQEDSLQIEAEMTESSTPPLGATKATAHTARPILISKETNISEEQTTKVHAGTDTPKLILAVVLFCLIVILGLISFIPGVLDNIKQVFVIGAL